MKAITLWQPWASLWCSPAKVHETRRRRTHHRGELIVHASKRPIDPVLEYDLQCTCMLHFGDNFLETLPLGAIIGTVQLIDCYSSNDHAPVDIEDRICGDFTRNRWLWKRGGFEVLARPIPWLGKQGMWNVPDEVMLARALK